MVGWTVVAGCGGGEAAVDAQAQVPDGAVAPIVASTSPADEATDVEQTDWIRAVFSQPMDAETLDETTFRLTSGGADVPGTVSYSEARREAVFAPAAPMDLLGRYTASVMTSATSAAGVALAMETSWTFTIRDERWGPIQHLSDEPGTAYAPQIGVDDDGNAIAVWHEVESPSNIWARRYVAGAGWAPAELLESGDDDAYDPRIAMAADGNAMVVWYQYAGTRPDVWSRRYVVGAGWAPAELVETEPTEDAQLADVGVDAAGNAIAVWNQHPLGVWAARYSPGTGWGTATIIGTGAYPRVAVDAAGNATAVWIRLETLTTNAWANRFDTDTGWGTEARIETGDMNIGSFEVEAQSGAAFAVWAQAGDVWSNRFDAAGGWGGAQVLESASGAAEAPQIAIDGAGNAIAIWAQSDGTVASIWANRFLVGAGWGAPELLELSDVGTSGPPSPEIAVNASGEAFAIWCQDIDFQPALWTNRFVPGAGWGGAVLADSNFATNPAIVVPPSGNAIGVWIRPGASSYSVVASRFE